MSTLKIVDRGDIPIEKAERFLGRRVWANPIHALDVFESGG